MRAADYDDWVTETSGHNGDSMHGLNGDILVWNPVTRRRHELSSMDIRVNVSVTVWPKILKEICRENNIHVLE